MHPIPNASEDVADDTADKRRDDDDRHRCREIKGLYHDRQADHVRPEAEIDEHLRPTERDEDRPDDMHGADEPPDSERSLSGVDVMVHSNKVIG